MLPKLFATAYTMTNGGFVLGDDPQGAFNPNDVPLDTTHSRVGMWIKNNNTEEPPYNVIVVQCLVEQEDDSYTWMNFYTMDGTDSTGNYFIGNSYNDGEWHYLEFDLPARLQQFGSAPTFVKLHLISVVGPMLDAQVDDIIVGQEILGKAYQLVPGAAAGGVIAAQSGTLGGIGISAWGTWYYHLNELGTMIAATKSDGTKHGVYAPDHFGNYRYINGQRPNYLGLDGKFLDVANGNIYNFGARWYDPERGRWLSREPLGLDGPNLYHFVFNEPINGFDINGLWYVNGNAKIGLGLGVSIGITIGDQGIQLYAGPAIMTLPSVSLTGSLNSQSITNIAVDAGLGPVAGSVGLGIGDFSQNPWTNPNWKPNQGVSKGLYGELGIGTPGASIEATTSVGLWPWENQGDDRK